MSNRKPRLVIGCVAATMLTLALVVAPGAPGEGPAAAAELTPFEDCDELTAWFVDSARDSVGPYGLNGAGWPYTDLAGGAAEAATAGAPVPASGADAGLQAPASGSGDTGTNLQEAGVDEPDMVKTDGNLVVAVRQDRLFVVDVSGSAPRLLGDVTLPQGTGGELLLVGERALVLGSSWHGSTSGPASSDAYADSMLPYPQGTSTAVFTVVDLSNPGDPRIQRTEEVDGGYLSARESDGAVRIVVSSRPDLPFVVPEGDRSETEATAENLRILESSSAQDWLPQVVRRDADGEVASREPLLDCGRVSHPQEPAGLGVLTVVTMDLHEPDAPMSRPIAVTADGDLVYASTDRLYVATTAGGWMFPQPLDATGRALPTGEPEPVSTQLHGFDITDRTATSYLGSGDVEGWLLGRWAMSAQDGMLRVATTRGALWGGGDAEPDTDSAVTILAESGDTLGVVGSVGGLGAGEQIRSVRWFGDLATVVTFRQTDPLYTVDLSEPSAPVVSGELKVTGYSAYLHPLGDGMLLGVGQDATADGRITGAQVSSFDLRDLARPTLADSVVEPEAWAEVEADSQAFTYLPEHRLALTPVSGPQGIVLWSVRVAPDGGLTTAAQWSPGRDAWLARAVPIGSDRVAAVSDGMDGSALTVLDVDGLRPVGQVRLG